MSSRKGRNIYMSILKKILCMPPDINAMLKLRQEKLALTLKDVDTPPNVNALKKAFENADDPDAVPYRIAAMDAIVAEAQQSLHTQAWRQFMWGIVLAFFAVLLLLTGCGYIIYRSSEIS